MDISRREERMGGKIGVCPPFFCFVADFALVFWRFTAFCEGKNGENAPCGVTISLIGRLDVASTVVIKETLL